MLQHIDELLNTWAQWLNSEGGTVGPKRPGSCISPQAINTAFSGGVDHAVNEKAGEQMDRLVASMPDHLIKKTIIAKYVRSGGSDKVAAAYLGTSVTTLKKRIDAGHHWLDGVIMSPHLAAEIGIDELRREN